VIKLRPRLFLILIIISIMLIFIIAAPSAIIAQEEETATEEEAAEPEPEPETLEFDISYGEVSDFGDKGKVFQFETKVTYEGEEEKYFEISSELPPGWTIEINPSNKTIDVPIVRLKPKSPETLNLKCSPLVDQEPGEYTFKIILRSTLEGDELEGSAEFTGIVKPDGQLELHSSEEMLNTDVVPGKDNSYTLIVKNTGTAPVEDISLSSSGEPEGWQVELIDTIDIVDVGEEVEVEVTITPPERTIAGDYSIRFNASSEDGSDGLEIRTIVGVPIIWRVVGIGLIALVIAGIAVIFERLGRR
jgi:uncharacterized membrane protein